MNQTDYPSRMYLKQLPISMLVVCLLFAAPVRAQDNPSDNADLKEFLKQVAEMQKKATGSQTQNVPAFDADKKLAEIEAATKEAARRQNHTDRNFLALAQAGYRQRIERVCAAQECCCAFR